MTIKLVFLILTFCIEFIIWIYDKCNEVLKLKSNLFSILVYRIHCFTDYIVCDVGNDIQKFNNISICSLFLLKANSNLIFFYTDQMFLVNRLRLLPVSM